MTPLRRRPAATLRATLLLAAALLLAACNDRQPASMARVVVFAAASLTAAFEQVATAFERAHPGVAVELHVAGTPQLVLQLREGAAADVFASADDANMQRVLALGRAAGEAPPFATNRLAIATPPGNPRGIRTLADLANPGLRVLLCGPEVPAGRYAREALQRAGVAVRSASDEPSVKAVVTKVRLGEADAGIVYATDVAAAGEAVHGVGVAAGHDVVARYPIVALTGGGNGAGGLAFVAFVRGEAGQRVLRSFGFGPP